MTQIKAFIFDFIGTLISVRNYDMETSKLTLCRALVKAGFEIDEKCFLEEYGRAHEKYRLIRYQELVEVTNAVWISDALNCLGFKTTLEDLRLKEAVNVFFKDYVNSLRRIPCARQLLTQVSKGHKLGLISNFTYAPVIYTALRKLDLNRFLNAVLVSEDVGWRKPNRKIFQEALRRLGAKAEETVYIGDSPLEDICGAAQAGMRTIFVPSQFYTLEDMHDAPEKPDLIVKNVCELYRILPKFIKNIQEAP